MKGQLMGENVNITYAVVVKNDMETIHGQKYDAWETVGHFTSKNTAEKFIDEYCSDREAKCVIEIQELNYINKKNK
jgi:hypothetical protein